MQWYEIGILSTLEIISMLLIWSKLNRKINLFNIKNMYILFIILTTTIMFFIYEVDIGFLVNYIVLCTMIILLFKLAIRKTIIQFLIVLSLLASIQFIFIYILSLVKGEVIFLFNNGFLINLAIVIVSILINKFVEFDKIEQYILQYRNYITIIIVNIAGVVLLLIYIWRINEEFIRNYMAYLIVIVFLWECLNMFFLYQSLRIRQQQKVIDIHERYTPFLKNMVHEVRQKQHDFKNHLNTLYGLSQNKEDKEAKEEIKEYIEKLIDDIKSTDKLLNIKDKVLSAIIYSKKALAEEKNICFDVEFISEIPEYPLEKYELVQLLGNLLDNAIEAAGTTKNQDNRKIVLTLGIEEDYKIIEVENTGGTLHKQNINKIFDRGFSTKKGKHRGYGLYNVKKIVNYYHGTIELSFDGDYTIFKILF